MSARRANCPHLFVSLIAMTLLIPVAANAQDKQCPKVASLVVDDKRVDVKSASISLGDRIIVRIEEGGSCDHVAESPKAESPKDSWLPGISNEDAIKLTPFLNGRAFKGIHPEAIDPKEHTVTFHLIRTEESKAAWSDLLSRPGFSPRVVKFSVGLEDGAQIDSDVGALHIIIFKKNWVIAGVVLFLLLFFIFFRLARFSTLVRDPGTNTDEAPRVGDLFKRPFRRPTPQLGPYSLARVQMAFWFFLVIVSFVVIWMVIGDTGTITQGVLVLIGISAGTAVGATVIDSGRLPTTPDPLPGRKSEGWFTDILSDETGVSFHRFQICVWTIVLGFVFCRAVFDSLAMPDFSTNLLTLMGISSGTYLGMKPFEKKAPEADTAQPGGNQEKEKPGQDGEGGEQENDPGI